MAPDYEPPEDARGPDALRGDEPFIMQADGKGVALRARGPRRRADAHALRAARVAVRQPALRRASSPTRRASRSAAARTPTTPRTASPGVDVFPYVATTYRLTEHHTAGGMSRWLPYLAELQPEMFCEVSPALARERGLEHGGWMTVVTMRAAIEARVMVTDRDRRR